MKSGAINLFLLAVSLGLMLVVALYHINYLDYKSAMPYSERGSISTSDFKGLKHPFETFNGNYRFAFIATEIRALSYADNKWGIVTYFHPSRSYIFNKRTWSKSLLRHELYHLDITEIAARQLREKISALENVTEGGIDALLLEYYAAEQVMQRLYDHETEHSVSIKNQKRWEVKIDSMLSALDKYSDIRTP